MPNTHPADAEPVALTPALIVEDDPAMQQRLCALLAGLGCDRGRIALADSVAAARRLLEEGAFGIALVDIGLPDGSGVELISWLRAHRPEVASVVISAWRAEEVIFSALRAGAVGYLLKERDDLELSLALRSIEQGGASIDPSVAMRILAWVAGNESMPAISQGPAAAHSQPPQTAAASPPALLTPRERSILELVSRGLSNREMAEALSISRLTVECHTKNIYRKLAVNSRTEAVYQARRHGLLR